MYRGNLYFSYGDCVWEVPWKDRDGFIQIPYGSSSFFVLLSWKDNERRIPVVDSVRDLLFEEGDEQLAVRVIEVSLEVGHDFVVKFDPEMETEDFKSLISRIKGRLRRSTSLHVSSSGRKLVLEP